MDLIGRFGRIFSHAEGSLEGRVTTLATPIDDDPPVASHLSGLTRRQRQRLGGAAKVGPERGLDGYKCRCLPNSSNLDNNTARASDGVPWFCRY